MTFLTIQPWTLSPAAMSLALLIHPGVTRVRSARMPPPCLMRVSDNPSAVG
jgi:hypothetical protein